MEINDFAKVVNGTTEEFDFICGRGPKYINVFDNGLFYKDTLRSISRRKCNKDKHIVLADSFTEGDKLIVSGIIKREREKEEMDRVRRFVRRYKGSLTDAQVLAIYKIIKGE